MPPPDRATTLCADASRVTNLTRFGEDSFRDGLTRLLAAADTEAHFTDRGRVAFDAMVIDYLSRRLEVEDWFHRHPEIDDQQIIAPTIGLGLPRTGSTALGFLLAQDPDIRTLRTWEAAAPCPPPEQATQHTDPRIARMEQAMIRRNTLFPRMQAMLPSTATGPTECQTFMGHDFKSQIFQAFAHIPSYVHWLNHTADLVPTYTYVKRVLKLLQWRCPPTNWRLKNPTHALFITALDQVFPDARFIMTHRAITSVVPSVCDLYLELQQAFTDHVDTAFLGRQNTEIAELGMRRMIAFRDTPTPTGLPPTGLTQNHRFFDIHFAPFQADPFPTLQRLYDFLGERLTPTTIARMQEWRRDTPREKHGAATYRAADFGLDPAALHARFAFYNERFNVAPA